jgi:hypothetical protein
VSTIAHAGGIPEALSVILPLVAVVVLLRIGAKRQPDDDSPSTDDEIGPDGSVG